MAKVISNNSLESHSVNKYNFKVLALGATDNSKENKTDDESKNDEGKDSFTPENNPKARATDIDSSALSTNSKDSLIESLMQKTDEMSSNFIKLQMKLEAKEEEHQIALQKLKESAFSEGFQAGKEEAAIEQEKSVTSLIEQFASSVKTLDESATSFEHGLEAVKNELIFAALDIAQEVIKVELSQNSSEVAELLANELIKDLQGASKITLKVNPKDHGSVSEHVGKLDHIEVVSDRAVSAGGVIVISDAGNIDAQISKRFQRVKKAALDE